MIRNTILAISLMVVSPPLFADCGIASWYGGKHKGRRTANGDIFDPNKLTAASNSHKMGTRLRVSYKGKSVVVKVNDTGGFKKYGRVLDLSERAAEVLGMKQKGVARVCFKKQ
jgi:rare lipoprotein A